MAGYLYGCCPGGQYQLLKIGMTRCDNPRKYIHDSYARTMVPLQEVFIIPVSSARVVEAMVHHMLAPFRLDERHEVFNMLASEGGFNQQLWNEVRDKVMACDDMSGLLKPEHPDVVEARMKAEERARQEAKEEAKVQNLEAQAREREDRKKAKKQQRAAQQKEHDAAQQKERDAAQQRASSELDRALTSFITNYCTVSEGLQVMADDFKEAFVKATANKITSSDLIKKMKARGFENTRKRVAGVRASTFLGLSFIE